MKDKGDERFASSSYLSRDKFLKIIGFLYS